MDLIETMLRTSKTILILLKQTGGGNRNLASGGETEGRLAGQARKNEDRD
jgi:hypothetical protein